MLRVRILALLLLLAATALPVAAANPACNVASVKATLCAAGDAAMGDVCAMAPEDETCSQLRALLFHEDATVRTACDALEAVMSTDCGKAYAQVILLCRGFDNAVGNWCDLLLHETGGLF